MSAISPSFASRFPRRRVLADVIPGHRVRDVVLVLAGAAVTGLAAQVSFTIPAISPVPYTLQTLAVLLVGASFGLARGIAAMALYVGAGLAGVPWFAGGAHGYSAASATMGYLVGFIVAAAVLGWLSQRGNDRRVMSAITEMFLATVIVYGIGVAWLMASLNVGLDKGLQFGLYPFVVTDTIKLLVAAAVLPLVWRVVGGSSSR